MGFSGPVRQQAAGYFVCRSPGKEGRLFILKKNRRSCSKEACEFPKPRRSDSIHLLPFLPSGDFQGGGKGKCAGNFTSAGCVSGSRKSVSKFCLCRSADALSSIPGCKPALFFFQAKRLCFLPALHAPDA